MTKPASQRPVRRLSVLGKAAASMAAVLGVMASFVPAPRAALIGYTDFAAFQAGLSGAGLTANTLNFDALTAGTSIASGGTLGGITFTYNFGGVSLQVSTGFETTSGANYLGSDDGGVLQDGDDFDLSFGSVNAIGLFFITADSMFDGDITLSVGGGSVGLASADVQFLPLGDQVFFLGLIDDMNLFSAASIATIGGGFFTYNVDDITTAAIAVPEPASLPLLAVGLIGLWAAARRRREAA